MCVGKWLNQKLHIPSVAETNNFLLTKFYLSTIGWEKIREILRPPALNRPTSLVTVYFLPTFRQQLALNIREKKKNWATRP